MQSLMSKNINNKDQFDLLAHKEIHNDVRQVVWKICLVLINLMNYRKINLLQMNMQSK